MSCHQARDEKSAMMIYQTSFVQIESGATERPLVLLYMKPS